MPSWRGVKQSQATLTRQTCFAEAVKGFAVTRGVPCAAKGSAMHGLIDTKPLRTVQVRRRALP